MDPLLPLYLSSYALDPVDALDHRPRPLNALPGRLTCHPYLGGPNKSLDLPRVGAQDKIEPLDERGCFSARMPYTYNVCFPTWPTTGSEVPPST